MDLKSLFGGVSMGRDTSGNFKMSLVGDRMDLAVKTADGQFYARDEGGLRNVTGVTLDAFGGMIFKLPATKVNKGDVIVVSESPFNAVFVEEVGEDERVRVLNPAISSQVDYVQPKNLLGQRFFIKATSLLDSFGGDKSQNSLLLLLLSGKGEGGSQTDLLPLLLMMMQGYGGAGELNNPLLMALLLRGGAGSGDPLETLLLLQALGGFNMKTFGQGPGKGTVPLQSSTTKKT